MSSSLRYIFAIILFILIIFILIILILSFIGFNKVVNSSLNISNARGLFYLCIAAAVFAVIILIMSIIIFFYNPKSEIKTEAKPVNISVKQEEPVLNNPFQDYSKNDIKETTDYYCKPECNQPVCNQPVCKRPVCNRPVCIPPPGIL